MIGCGHVENGEWQFKSLVAENLSAGEEMRIIKEWVDHMGSVRDRLDSQNDMPRVFHWSAAEPTGSSGRAGFWLEGGGDRLPFTRPHRNGLGR